MGEVYEKFKDFTMVSPETFDANLELAASIPDRGCVVECGVWKGGMIAGLAKTLGPDRMYYLFDSFQGLPWAEEIDGWAAQEYQRNDQSPSYYNNCRIEMDYAVEAMTLADVPYTIVPGWFEETVPEFPFPEPIALLRLDGDWYSSTMVCLKNLYSKVAPGGIVIIDDFFAWEGCRRATLEFFSLERVPIYFDSARNMSWVVKP